MDQRESLADFLPLFLRSGLLCTPRHHQEHYQEEDRMRSTICTASPSTRTVSRPAGAPVAQRSLQPRPTLQRTAAEQPGAEQVGLCLVRSAPHTRL